jgi:hypothetical protein
MEREDELSKVVADNWSLQNVAELFSAGLGDDQAAVIAINDGKTEHTYEPIDYGVVRIEALFDLLNDVVLKDEIIVDEQFIEAWKRSAGPLDELNDAGIIQPFPFLASSENLRGPREEILKRLCITPTLQREHDLNTSTWEARKSTPYPLLSATLWGGAGMLARSHVYECNYTPHPLRKRLFLRTGVFLDKADSSAKLHKLIESKRLQLVKKNSTDSSLHSAFLQLPPIPFRIIEESSNLSQLFDVAVQMRSELKDLRYWLNEFQNAIEIEDVKKILECERVLDSVSKHADAVMTGSGGGGVDMSLGLGVLKLAIKTDPVNLLKNQFGVRSTINSLIFDKPGRNALKKLLRWLGEEHSAAGYNVIQSFVATSKADD